MGNGAAITLKQLRYLIAIVEAGSFSAAARIACIAQPALSRQIGLLENELGVSLLERFHDGVGLTDAGQRLYDTARTILQTVDSLKDELKSTPNNPKGQVLITIPVTASALLLPLIVIQAREKFPAIELKVCDGLSEASSQAVIMGQVDFGVLPNAEELENVYADPIFSENLYWVGQYPPPNAGETITLSQAAAGALAMPLKGESCLRRRVDQAAMQAGVELKMAYEQHTAQGISSLVRSGLAATICNWPAAKECSPYRPLLITDPHLHRTISIAHSVYKPLSIAAECIRALVYDILVEAVCSGQWRGQLIQPR